MNRTGVIWMIHSVEEDSPRTAASELYRNLTVSPGKLESLVVAARARGYEFVSVKRFLADKSDGMEHRDVLITVDDGLRNIYSVAFPLFRRLDVPFAFFVATGLIEQGFNRCRNAEMDGMAILCDHVAAHGGSFGKLFRRFRHIRRFLPFLSGRSAMRMMLGHAVNFDRYKRETICSPAELREMAESGICEIGSHTVNHVHLDRIRNVERELVESKRKLEDWTGRACEYFSYPYGHFDARSLALVRHHFKAAMQDVSEGPFDVCAGDDDFSLKRVICLPTSEISELL